MEKFRIPRLFAALIENIGPLLDHITGRPIADELCDKNDYDTIKTFLRKHLYSKICLVRI